MSNTFTYFTVSLPFSSLDVSIAISNLLQTTTASHSPGANTRDGVQEHKMATSRKAGTLETTNKRHREYH